MIADPEARKEFLKKGKRCFLCLNVDHVSRNCTKSKSCFYCKGMHNSAICHNNKFGNKKCKSKNLERVSVHLKNSKEKFEVEVLCTPFICLPIQRQSSNFPKQNFDYLKELELHNSKSKNDIDLLLGSDFY